MWSAASKQKSLKLLTFEHYIFIFISYIFRSMIYWEFVTQFQIAGFSSYSGTSQAFRALCIMRCRKTLKDWICLVGNKSIAVIEALYNSQVWKKLWWYISKYYDNAKPNYPKSVTEMKSELNSILNEYIESNMDVICEVARITAKACNLELCDKFSAYHTPKNI